MKSIEVVEIIGFTPAMVEIIWILNKREKFLMHKKPKGIREWGDLEIKNQFYLFKYSEIPSALNVKI